MANENEGNVENPEEKSDPARDPLTGSETSGGLAIESGAVPDTVAAAIALFELKAAGAEAITAAGRRSVTARVSGTPDPDVIRARLGSGFTVDSSEGRLAISW